MNNNEIRNLLDEEIKSVFNDLSSLGTGSKERLMEIQSLEKLYKLKIEEDKNIRSDEAHKSEEQFNMEKYMEQSLCQNKDRYFKLGVDLASIVLPLIFYAVWMKRGFKFEETGTYTSTTFRGLFNRFKPTNRN